MDATTKEAIAILRKAKRLMSRPGVRLVKEEYAKTSDGFHVGPMDDAARGFCSLGAMYRANGRSPEEGLSAAQLRALFACEKEIAGEDVPPWNDKPHRRKADVIKLYDRAIARLKGEAR